MSGEGPGATILVSSAAFDYVFRSLGTTGIAHFGVSDMMIDVNSATRAAGIRVEYATRGLFRNIRIVNVPSGGWGMVIVGPMERSPNTEMPIYA